MRGRFALSPIEVAQGAVAAIRARLWLVVVCVAAFPVAALAHNALAGGYEARVSMAFNPVSQNAALVNLGIPSQGPPTGDQITSDEVLNAAIGRLDLVDSLGSLRERVRIEQPEGDQRATLIATGSTRAEALELASAWATEYVSSRNRLLARQFDAVAQEARQQLLTARRSGDRSFERQLRLKLAELEGTRAAASGDSEVTRSATAMGAGTKLSEFAALALGLVVGLVAAAALALFDRRIRTAPVAAATFDLPLLGAVPGGAPDSEKAKRDTTAAASRIQAHLAVADGGWDHGTIVVTPATRGGEGDEVALSLARSYAESGAKVALIVWRIGRKPEAPPTVDGAMVRVVQGRWARLEEELRGLEHTTEIVIVDAPSLADHGDVVLASQRADRWLISVPLEETRGDDAEVGRREWEGLGHQPTGIVVVEPPTSNHATAAPSQTT